MAHESITAPSCLSSFLRRSQSKALAPAASSNVSTPQAAEDTSSLYVRSWGALALGVICGCVTAFVVFEDVLRNDAPITTDHVLTAAVIAIAASTGHMWWRRLWSSAFLVGLGLLFLFGSSLVYLVIASGGRNAEVAANKRHAAHFANAERERIKPLMAIEQERKRKTQDKLQADCVEGKKGKGHCDGLRTTLSVYTMAVKGYEADLEKLGPEQEENGMLKATARLIIAINGIPTPEQEEMEKSYVERLEVILPYVKALLVEAATVVFLGVAFGHRATVASAAVAATARPQPIVLPLQRKARLSQAASARPATACATVVGLRTTVATANCEALALQLLQRTATVAGQSPAVAQEDIVQLFGGNKSRASRWLGRLEREGTVERWSNGRHKFAAFVTNL